MSPAFSHCTIDLYWYTMLKQGLLYSYKRQTTNSCSPKLALLIRQTSGSSWREATSGAVTLHVELIVDPPEIIKQ